MAFFALSACPSGWLVANGANGMIDVRGGFIRALDDTPGGPAGRDPDWAGRGVGSWQGDAIRNITGKFGVSSGVGQGFFNDYSGAISPEGYGMGGLGSNTYQGYYKGMKFNAAGVVPTAPENRPVNVALLACQKL